MEARRKYADELPPGHDPSDLCPICSIIAKALNRQERQMLCRDCKFWDTERAWGEKKDKAACRALPPVIRQNGMACDANAMWPTTTADQWCGSFVRRGQQ